MAAILKEGKTKTVLVDVTPSTAFTKDTFVKLVSGKLVPCAAGDAAVLIYGVIRHTIASTDADYASDRKVPVEVPVEKGTLYIVDVGTGTIAQTDQGTEFDLAGPGTIDQTATTDKVAFLHQYLSSTKGVFEIKFRGSY